MNFFKNFKLFTIAALSAASLAACKPETPEEKQLRISKEVEEVIANSQQLIQAGKVDKAIDSLEAAFVSYGDDVKIFEALAYAYADKGNHLTSGKYFEKAGDINLSDSDMYVYAASAYEKAGNPNLAINAYKKYLQKNPKSLLAWKSLARNLELAGMFEDALNAHFSAIKNAGRSANAEESARIGALFLKVKNLEQSKNWLSGAYKSAPADDAKLRSGILEGLVEISLAQGDMPNLIKYFNELEKLDAELVKEKFPNLRAHIDEFNRKMKEAEEALQKQKEEQAKKEEEARKAEEAKKIEEQKKLEEQKRIDEEKAEEERKIAEAKKLEEQKKLEAERKIEEERLAKERLLMPEYASEASAKLVEKGEIKEAEKISQTVVSKHPKSAVAWASLSKVYTAKGDNKSAFYSAKEALNASPESVEYTILYLNAANKVFSVEKFLDTIYAAREKFPNNPEIMLGLARTYVILKNYEEARYNYILFLQYADKNHPLRSEVEEEIKKIPAAE